MIRIRFKPHWRLILAGAMVTFVMLLGALSESSTIQTVAQGLLLGLVAFAVIDLYIADKRPDLDIQRVGPPHLGLGGEYSFRLLVENKGSQTLHFALQEHHPVDLDVSGLGRPIRLGPLQQAQTNYIIKPLRRGPCLFSATEIRIDSRFRFWQLYWLLQNPTEYKVYPDFKEIRRNDSIDALSNTTINGLKVFARRGQGMEFRQLREYRDGDSMRQIDWRASSRMQKLISREYQEEQNQQVIVMLDSGKRMNVQTKQGSHFDVALGALLMLGHTVLKQGDWFSMQSFGREERWLPNVKGAQNISRLMNHFYDLYPDEGASDYLSAAQALVEKRAKRALVLLVTTLSDEDFSDLTPALTLLRKHHLVTVVSINNQAIDETLNKTLESPRDADSWCAALDMQQRCTKNMRRLSKQGIICVEAAPANLLPSTLNVYLSVKRSGAL